MNKLNVQAFTNANFNEEVLRSPLPVLVHFMASWCGPCNALDPIVAQVAKDLQGKAKVGKLNIDENPEITRKFGIRLVPTCVVFQRGTKQDSQMGIASYDTLRELLGV